MSAEIVDIFGKSTLKSVFDCLARFNRGAKNLTIRGIGGNVNKCIETGYILQREFDASIRKTELKSMAINGIETPYIDLSIEYTGSCAKSGSNGYQYPQSGFLDFPTWYLLLDNLLAEGKLLVSDGDKTHLVTISEKDGQISCHIHADRAEKNHQRIRDGLGRALYRSGLILPENWKGIAEKLSQLDDVIIGVDTNILYNCTLSRHLIPTLDLVDPKEYVHTPNWMMIVIPNAVMHELEEAANKRTDGHLLYEGRMGFRALQEIIELNQSIDIEGVSLLIVGEANPVLDTRVELQGLRQDFCRSSGDTYIGGLRKSSSGDMVIRDQFKNFLRQLNFHKGIYFLTADKSNAALARAEGLHPIYFKFPHAEFRSREVFGSSRIHGDKGEVIGTGIFLSDILYELAVHLGSISISQGDIHIDVRCDTKGEKLDYWVYKSLRIEEKDFDKLKAAYKGIVDLEHAIHVWNKLADRFIGLDEL